MNISYDGKAVFVTGGTSGIGKAAAIAFAEAGARVVVTGRREKEGAEVVSQITNSGGSASFFRTDVSNEADVQNAVAFTVSTYGRLDVALNNAGVEVMGPLDKVTEEQYRKAFDINVWGVLAAMKHEISAMLKTGGGAIVNVSSVAGHIGLPGASIYVATKHAVEGLTKAAAIEYAKQNIRVNAVAPGTIETEMIDRMAGKEQDSEVRKALLSLHPVGRFGSGEDVAAAVLYLASDAAKFTTGATLKVDGGWTAQ
jgi:NAD(P)-dependent dehydrogenase (short-subunit alcohol dehydrogenase family)